MKKIILITMLMSAVFAQSDCNQDNWREYGKNLKDCQLQGVDFRGEGKNSTLRFADFSGADLTDANLSIFSGRLGDRIDLNQADFRGAILTGVNLGGARMGSAKFDGVISGGIIGTPLYLTDGWSVVDGFLEFDEWGDSNPPSDMMADGDDPDDMMADRELSDEIYNEINEGNPIKRSKWRAWKKENKPQVSKGKTTFRTIDKNNNGKIGTGEFFKFYQRWIQE